ncbi:juvenile hormone esterase-like isoform X3 [Diabrotica virgifera virgifera]|uniref:Carboxylic ester hydrolase n=1 Tax=Diabrotica virgifera virgifera TaxID=50390 RepID=A0ABM5KZ25_DIAVI|nr:juvenile hormone esterase-like isoform X3 [Diabrotica virgifera virgifera]
MTPICLPFVVNLLAIIFVEVSSENVQVTTNEGTILGTTSLSEKNQTIYMFNGIPFVEPPNRFELAVPKSNWTGILNCTVERDQCVQGIGIVTGSEDCLYLNVASPKLNGTAPVLVWIHGGTFNAGNGSLISYSPKLFLEEGLVVVGIQYRLGVFGFLSTGDLTCPGNWGLKDQTLALQWVQRNIAHFGGDPKRVTIWGASAGSACVSLHLNSARSKGLFNGAIMNSGVSLCLWALSRTGNELAHNTGAALGVGSANSTQLIENLKKVDYVSLQNVSATLSVTTFGNFPLIGIALGPVIEVPHPTAFLAVKSDNSLLSGQFNQVPMLVGHTTNELGLMAPELFSGSIPTLQTEPKKLVPADIISDKNLTEAGLKIRKEFFGNATNITMDSHLVNFFNNNLFFRPINRFVSDVKKFVHNTYLYQFSYKGDIEKASGVNFTGVVHGEDVSYLLRDNLPFSKKDLNVRSKLVKMYSNFCKYSKPIPLPTPSLDNADWLPASNTSDQLLFNIDYKIGYTVNPHLKELQFFDNEIYNKYGQGVYDTY